MGLGFRVICVFDKIVNVMIQNLCIWASIWQCFDAKIYILQGFNYILQI